MSYREGIWREGQPAFDIRAAQAAAVSMPGMMDTVLHLGLNKNTLSGLAEQTGNHRFALDSYR